MGLIGVWNINFMNLPTLAVLPYDGSLRRFPAYLQQLEMESNGKSVTLEGRPVEWQTAAVIWGEPGNNGQHSFFQLLHQGTPRAALDFLLPARSSCGNQAQQDLAIARSCWAWLPHEERAGSRKSSAARGVPWCRSWKKECWPLLPGSPQITAAVCHSTGLPSSVTDLPLLSISSCCR